jgi:hypothetical protein
VTRDVNIRVRQTTSRYLFFSEQGSLKQWRKLASNCIALMLRLFKSKIESNFGVGDYAWLRRDARSTRSEQAELSASFNNELSHRTNN